MKHLVITLFITCILTAGFAVAGSNISAAESTLRNGLFLASAFSLNFGCAISGYWMHKFNIN